MLQPFPTPKQYLALSDILELIILMYFFALFVFQKLM